MADSYNTSCVQSRKFLMRLCECAGLSEPLLVVYGIWSKWNALVQILLYYYLYDELRILSVR